MLELGQTGTMFAVPVGGREEKEHPTLQRPALFFIDDLLFQSMPVESLPRPEAEQDVAGRDPHLPVWREDGIVDLTWIPY